MINMVLNSIKLNPIIDSLLAITTGYIPFHDSACLDRFTFNLLQDPMVHPISSFISQSHDLYDCTWSSTNSNLIIIATHEEGSQLIKTSLHDHENPRETFLSEESMITSVDWHPNDDSFLSASTNGIVNHWSIGQQPNPQGTYNHPHVVSYVTWNPRDPTLFASTCFDRILRIWDIRNQNAAITIEADDEPLISCDWNWHGKTRIVSASHQRNHIKVWDINQTHIPIRVFNGGHIDGVCRVKFSPHREYEIASSSSDHRVVLWDYGPGDADPIIIPYEHHAATVFGLDMSKRIEGQLASCGVDGLVQVWQHALPEA